jgi:hypothetical protein
VVPLPPAPSQDSDDFWGGTPEKTAIPNKTHGHIRRSNDQSVDARLRFFAKWLKSLGYSKQSAISLTTEQLIDTLGAYLEDVKRGRNLQKKKLTGQSIRNYVTAAAICMSLLTRKMPQYFDPATLSYKRIFLHPYLHAKIMQWMI